MKYFVVIAALLVSAIVPYSTASVLDSAITAHQDLVELVHKIGTILQSSTNPTINKIVEAVKSSNLGPDLEPLVKKIRAALQSVYDPAAINATATRAGETLSSSANKDVPDVLPSLTTLVKGSSNDELANILGNLSGSVSSSSNSDGLTGIIRKASSITKNKAQPKAQPEAQPKA